MPETAPVLFHQIHIQSYPNHIPSHPSSIRQKPFPDNLAGIRYQHKRRRLNPAYIVAQLQGLAALHGGHDDGLFVMGKCSLGVVDRSASVQRVNDVVTDGVRVITYNIETFA